MSPARRQTCDWRKISVLDCIQSYGDDTSGSIGSAGASSAGTLRVPFRLITCDATAGKKATNIDDPADPSETANHTYDRGLHGYRHVKKCIQLAEQAGHNNVIIGGDFNNKLLHWGSLVERATPHQNIVLCRFIVDSQFFVFFDVFWCFLVFFGVFWYF